MTHSTYSRLWLGLNASKCLLAAAFFFNAPVKSEGTATGVFGADGFRSTFTPFSLSIAAFRMYPDNVLSDGRSFSDVMRPKLPIASSSVPGPSTRLDFQNPNVQCCLKAAIPHIIPL